MPVLGERGRKAGRLPALGEAGVGADWPQAAAQGSSRDEGACAQRSGGQPRLGGQGGLRGGEDNSLFSWGVWRGGEGRAGS